MPKKTTKTAKKTTASKASLPAVKKTQGGDLKNLRSELFSLKMKHALHELKEVHKLRQARKAIARHLTKLHISK